MHGKVGCVSERERCEGREPADMGRRNKIKLGGWDMTEEDREI